MSTTVRRGRAWVPATVTTLLLAVLLFASGLLREILGDQDIASLRDPDNVFGAFVYIPMAPLGGPGIVSDRPLDGTMAQLAGGLLPVVIVVFLLTWLAARTGSALTVLLGAWLGTILGVGLGALVAFQIFLAQNDIAYPALHQTRVVRLGSGLYWGAVAGLLVALVALLTWLIVRPRADDTPPEPHTDPAPWPPPAPERDVSSYPPPGRHQMPTGASEPTEETVRAPEPPPGDPRPGI